MVRKKGVKAEEATKTTKSKEENKTAGTSQARVTRPKQGTVQGKVQYSDGSPRAGLTVKVFDRNVAGETFLGQAVAKKNGSYAVNYPLEKLGGKGAADLVIRVYQDDTLLQESEVIFNAKEIETKDFTFPVEVSPEFKRYSEKIQPLLIQDKIEWTELTKNQINFIAKKTGLEPRKIEMLADAKRQSGGDENLAAVHYALRLLDFPLHPSLLLGRDRTQIVRAVRQAEVTGAIPPLKQEELDHILDTQLPRLRAGNIVRDWLGALFETIPKNKSLSEDQKFVVAEVIGEHGIDYAKLPAQLKEKGLKPTQITTVECTLRLDDLTHGHLPLMAHLQEIAKDDTKKLVNSRRDRWIEMAYVHGVPAKSDLSPEAYAKEMELAVEGLYPTAALAAKLTDGLSAVRYPAVEKAGTSVAKFINNNPTFDIIKSDIPSYIKDANLDEIEDKDQLQYDLLSFKRLGKIATWDEVFALQDAGFRSHLHIVNVGREHLQKHMEGSIEPEQVDAIYDAAVRMHTLSMQMMMNLMPRFSPTPVAAMGMSNRLVESNAYPPTEKADGSSLHDDLSGTTANSGDYGANLRNLMGTLDYCECSECQSVLSPAAYLVDLLQFLKPDPLPESAAFTELLRRRPDLVDLEHSCNNTIIEFPHIDQVLEILENAVAFPVPVPLEKSGVNPLEEKPLPAEVHDSLQATVLDSINKDLIATREKKSFTADEGTEVWTVIDQDRRWSLNYTAPDLYLEGPSRIGVHRRKFSGFTDILKIIRYLDKGLDERGSISSEFKRALELLLQRIYGRYTYISGDVQIFPETPGHKWTIKCYFGFNVLQEFSPSGQAFKQKLTLTNPDNSVIFFSEVYSDAILRRVANELNQNQITLLAELFHISPISGGYSVTSQPNNNSWSIKTIESVNFEIIATQPHLTITSLTHQTSGKSKDLKAIPGNQNPLAYQILRNANVSPPDKRRTFPWSLPFDLPLETVRGLLNRAGITRRQLIELANSGTYLDNPTSLYEVLGLSVSEAELIKNFQVSENILQSHWGVDKFNGDGDKVTIYDSILDKRVEGRPLDLLRRVSILLQQARINNDELEKIFNTRFIREAGPVPIQILHPADTSMCDLSQDSCSVDWPHLDHMHRFIRLLRKLDWKVEDLDLALITFRPGKKPLINSKLLTFISHIKRLQERLDLPANVLISWFGTDTTFLYRPYTVRGQPEVGSLYEQVFLNPLVQKPPDEAFILNSSKSDLQNRRIKLSEKAAEISAALGIRKEDFSQLVSGLKLEKLINLDSLFGLYKTTSLVKVLGISVADFFRIQQFYTQDSPFEDSADLLKFCETVGFIQDSGFSVDDLSYILQHHEIPGSPLFLTDDQAAQMLAGIRSKLQAKITAVETQVRDKLKDNPRGLTVKKEVDPNFAAVMSDKNWLASTFGTIAIHSGDKASQVTKDLDLSFTPPNGSTVTWSSSNTAILENGGKMIRPAFTAGSVTVTLTATLTKGTGAALVSDTQKFTLTVIRVDPTIEEKAEADLRAITIGFGPGDNASRVTQNLLLPIEGPLGSDLTWLSNGLDLLNIDSTGSNAYVTRPVYSRGDQPVTLNAFIRAGTPPYPSRDFQLIVIKQPETDAKALAADLDTLSIGFHGDDEASHVTGPLMLTHSPGPNGSTFEWSSKDTNYIEIDPNGDTASVDRPAFASGDATVILTATATKTTAPSATVPSTILSAARDFTLTVRRQDPDADTAARADVDAVAIGFAPGDSRSHVTKNLVLPNKGPYGSPITWSSCNDNIKIDNTVGIGTVLRPDFARGDTNVTLKATTISTTGRSFDSPMDVTVIKQTDREAVAADLAALKLGGDASDVTQNLTLPSSPGPNGSTITWSIPSQPYISLQNNQITVLPKPVDKDVSIPLYATIQKGSARAVKIFSSDNFLDKDPLDGDRLSIVLSDFDVHTKLSDIVVDSIANLFSLEYPVVRELLVTDQPKTALLTKEAPGIPLDAIEVFIDPLFIGSDPKTPPGKTSFLDAYHLMYRLQKTAALLSTLNVNPAEMAWLKRQQYGLKVLDFNHLPVQKTGVTTFFREWQQLVLLFQLRDRTRGMGALLTKFGTALADPAADNKTRKQNAQKEIVKGLGLARDTTDPAISEAVNALDGIAREILGITIHDGDPEPLRDYREPLKVKQLLDLLLAMKRLGADRSQVELLTRDWSSVTDDQATMAERAARDLLRAKYGEKSWHEILKPVSDALRVRQRDALVDYLVAREGLRDANELYNFYLIDPQMSPCMMTSRLVQAIAAVQLFIQRCLLNLEPKVSPADLKSRRPPKGLRVEEVGKKILLFPENWLYPELRDDKTQTFCKLESGIAQGEPSYELGKENQLGYLDEMAEIAQITVTGIYVDKNDDDTRTLYLVGRPPEKPYQYYWRRCDDFGGVHMCWGGWERLDIDATTDHVMPFVMDGRIYIAWPVFKKTKDEQKADIWEIQLAWIRRTAKGWGRKKLSNAVLTTKDLLGIKEDRIVTFRLEQSKELLTSSASPIQIYDTQMRFHIYGAAQFEPPITNPPDPDPDPIFVHYEQETVHHYLPSEDIIEIHFEPNIPNPETLMLKVRIRVFKKYKVDSIDVYEPAKDSHTIIDFYFDEYLQNPFGSGGLYQTYEKVTNVYESPTVLDDSGNSDVVFSKNCLLEYPNRYRFFTRIHIKIEVPGLTSYEADVYPGDQNFLTFYQKTYIVEPPGESPTAGPNRALTMKHIGDFVLRSSDEVYQVSGSGNPLSIPVTPNTRVLNYGNGFREIQGMDDEFSLQSSSLQPSTPFAKTPGRYWAIPSMKNREIPALPELWYFEDDLTKLFLEITSWNDPKKWQAIVDNMEFFPKMREIAYSKLDELFSPRNLNSEIFNHSGLFTQTHTPNALMIPGQSHIVERVLFDQPAPSVLYNWEIFYHTPMLITRFFIGQQRFEDALRWLKYIFDPTNHDTKSLTTRVQGGDGISTQRTAHYWQFLPFRENATGETLQQLFEALAKSAANGGEPDASALLQIEHQLAAWKDEPFNPFAVARWRHSAFQWYTLSTYLDLIIASGDQLFRRDTRESINQATQLYILAGEILGPRPRSVKQPHQVPARSYRALAGDWDKFGNAWCVFTDLLPIQPQKEKGVIHQEDPVFGKEIVGGREDQIREITSLGMLYFCIPHNEKLLGYWDKVEDRLFKIRNCMNIEGIVQKLPLFAPPIDPELLIRAREAGLDIATVLADMAAPRLPYRWNVLLQKANELCSEVKLLGAALLSAMEKEDAEALALLRSGNEIALLNLVTQIKEQQVSEVTANLDVLKQNKEVVMERFTQYQTLLGKPAVSLGQDGLPVLETTSSLKVAENVPGDEAGLGLIQYEVSQFGSLDIAGGEQEVAGDWNIVSSFLYALNDYSMSFSLGGSVTLGSSTGGSHYGHVANAVAVYHTNQANKATHEASKQGMLSQYQRRQDEWVHQSRLALEEMKQIIKQIIAAEIRQAITQKDLENHEKQIEQAKSIDEFMHDKYTNKELYSWMIGEISSIYFQTYQLTYDWVKSLQRAFEDELGIKFTLKQVYWDSLKKGLLAGEKLSLDLKRMELAYLEQNKRELEMTQHISILQLDPLALIKLKETGECDVSIPEALIDLHHSGGYFRRFKTVSISMPCIIGSYTSVNCTLTLKKHSYRKTPLIGAHGYPRRVDTEGQPADDDRFVDGIPGLSQSIVTSSAQNDSGLFELNFRDERYLPFEFCGLISTWHIALPKFRQIDHDTISDFIMHIRYTARHDGALAEKVSADLKKQLTTLMQLADERSGLARLFSVKHEFVNEWFRFARDTKEQTPPLSIELTHERFPIFCMGSNIKIFRIDVVPIQRAANRIVVLQPDDVPVTLNGWNKTISSESGITLTTFEGGSSTRIIKPGKSGISIQLGINSIPADIEDIILICHYTVDIKN